MPTYEYACTSCGDHLEIVQSFSDAPLTTCPNCGGDLRKVFGSIGIVLKGSGFYRTDSRTSSNGKPAPKETDKTDKADKADKADGTSKSDRKDTSSSSSGTGGDSAASGSSTSTSASPSTSSSKGSESAGSKAAAAG